jgi:hypothetical protein
VEVRQSCKLGLLACFVQKWYSHRGWLTLDESLPRVLRPSPVRQHRWHTAFLSLGSRWHHGSRRLLSDLQAHSPFVCVMSSYFLRFFSFYERNCTTSKLCSRDAAPKNLFSTDAPDGPVGLRFLHLHTSPSIMCGVFGAFLCLILALFARADGG